MSYAPKIQVIDLRPVAARILSFIETNQADAFAYIGRPDLSPVKKFYSSVVGRISTIFPAFMVAEKMIEAIVGDFTDATISFRFELTIEGPDTDKLVADAEEYAFAFGSMLANLPPKFFDNDAPPQVGHQNFYLESIDTAFDEVTNSINNADAFFQVLTFRVKYKVTANPYAK